MSLSETDKGTLRVARELQRQEAKDRAVGKMPPKVSAENAQAAHPRACPCGCGKILPYAPIPLRER